MNRIKILYNHGFDRQPLKKKRALRTLQKATNAICSNQSNKAPYYM